MSAFDSELQQGLASLEADMADSVDGILTSPQITIAGKVWPCVKGVLKSGNDLERGGLVDSDINVIHVRLDAKSTDDTLFSDTTIPVEGDTVTFESVNYLLGPVDTGHGYIVLHLFNPHE